MPEKDPRQIARETGVIVQDALSSISEGVQNIIENALSDVKDVSSATLDDIGKGFKQLSRIQDTLASSGQKALQGDLSRADVAKIMMQRQAKLEALSSNIEILQRSAVELTEEESAELERLIGEKDKVKSINKEIEASLKEQFKASQRINDAQGITGNLLGGMQKITRKMGLSGFEDIFANAKDEAGGLARKLTENGKKTVGLGGKFAIAGKGMKTAFAGLGKALLGPLGIAMAVMKLISLFVSAQERTVAIAKQLTISRDAAEGIRQRFVAIAGESENILVNSKSLVEANASLVDNLGASVKFSSELLESQVFLTKNLGLSAESASGLNNMLAATGQSADEVIDNVIGINNQFALANGFAIPFSSIMKEIASTSAETQGYFGFSVEALAKGVLQVRKFGLNLDKAASVAKGLLNFEESISSELELELFTGKAFNLERARMLALTGDVAGATEDVMKQMQGLTEEQRKSPLIMEAAAATTGLSVAEINKAYLIQENLNMASEDYNKLLARGGKIGKENMVKQLALEGATREEIQKTLTIQESYGAALEKAKDQFTGLVNSGALDKLVDTIIQLADGLGSFFGVDTVSEAQKEEQLERASNISDTDLASMGISAQEYQNLVEKASLNKGAFGLTSDFAFATNAGIEEARVKLRELESQISPNRKNVNANDFTISTYPKDTIKVAGGTKLGGNVEDLLKILIESNNELVDAVKEGGDVYVDGNKTGMALALGSYRGNSL